MKFSKILLPVTVILTASATVYAGPFAYGICQTGCNVAASACYAAAGFTFGTVAAPAAPPLILACNAAQGTCMMILCAPLLVAPIP